jgi:hypothetical protein
LVLWTSEFLWNFVVVRFVDFVCKKGIGKER